MEENPPKTGKFALQFGILLGAINTVFVLMLYFQDLHYQQNWTAFTIGLVITLAVIILGIYQFKKANAGFLSIGEALKTGVGIALVAAIIGIIFNQLLINVIDPEMMTKATQYQMAQMEAQGVDPEQIEAAVEMGKKFQGPVMQIALALIGSLFIGLIFSLIGGLIMRKAKPAY